MVSRRNDIARGYPEAPLSDAELQAKFVRLAGSVASESNVAGLSEMLDNLDSLPSAAALARLLSKPQ